MQVEDTSDTELHRHEESEAAHGHHLKLPLALDRAKNFAVSPHAADFLADMSLPLIPNSAIAAVLPVLTF